MFYKIHTVGECQQLQGIRRAQFLAQCRSKHATDQRNDRERAHGQGSQKHPETENVGQIQLAVHFDTCKHPTQSTGFLNRVCIILISKAHCIFHDHMVHYKIHRLLNKTPSVSCRIPVYSAGGKKAQDNPQSSTGYCHHSRLLART